MSFITPYQIAENDPYRFFITGDPAFTAYGRVLTETIRKNTGYQILYAEFIDRFPEEGELYLYVDELLSKSGFTFRGIDTCLPEGTFACQVMRAWEECLPMISATPEEFRMMDAKLTVDIHEIRPFLLEKVRSELNIGLDRTLRAIFPESRFRLCLLPSADTFAFIFPRRENYEAAQTAGLFPAMQKALADEFRKKDAGGFFPDDAALPAPLFRVREALTGQEMARIRMESMVQP